VLWMMIVPTLTLLLIYKLYTDRVVWWEYLILYLAPLVVSLITILVGEKLCDTIMGADTEYHGGYVISCVWDEHWTEEYWVVVTDYDSKGNVSGSHLERRESYHPDYYIVHDSNGYEVDVDYKHYQYMVSHFGNEEETYPHRSGKCSSGDGRRFETKWNGSDETYTPCITQHRYENRVARSHSILNFREVSDELKKKYDLYDYPEIFNYHYQHPLLGWDDPAASWKLTRANCDLGVIKQVHIFMLVFHNQPLDAAIEQQMLWKNGNKNEIVICIGVDSTKTLTWVYPFAWDNERLKVDLREEIATQNQNGPLNMGRTVDIAVNLIQKEFSRKHFKDFKYIKLEIPWWGVSLVFLVVVLENAGFIYYLTQK
jgi:hypothetical protein